MAFSYDITTDRGQVRFNLGDTDSSLFVFEDAEIDQMLTLSSDVNEATVRCLRALLVSRARRAKMASLHGLTVNDQQVAKDLQASIKEFGGSIRAVLGVKDSGLMGGDIDFEWPTA